MAATLFNWSLKGAEKKMLQGPTGHRTVGGIRVSGYDAVRMEDMRSLAVCPVDFA